MDALPGRARQRELGPSAPWKLQSCGKWRRRKRLPDVHGSEPGRRYPIAVWVSAFPGATATAHIVVWDLVANVASHSEILRVHLFRELGSGTLYCDVRIYEEKWVVRNRGVADANES